MAEQAATGNTGGEGKQGDDNQDPETIPFAEYKKLKEKSQRLEGKLTDTEKKRDELASIFKDIDPEEARALKAKNEELERKAAEKDPSKLEEIYDRKMKKLREDLAAEKSPLEQELNKLRTENKTLKVTDKVMAEIGGLFHSDTIEFIKLKVEQLCDLDEDGTIVIKDENGDPLYKNGKIVGLKEFGEMLADKYPNMARAQGSSGSKDATPGQRSQGGRITKVPESPRRAERHAEPEASP